MRKGNYPLERFSGINTPFYFYDLPLLQKTLDAITQETRASWKVHYALKANANPVILQLIAKAGFGADCVSGGEIRAAERVLDVETVEEFLGQDVDPFGIVEG